MIALLAMLPWAIAVIILLLIMNQKGSYDNHDEEYPDEFNEIDPETVRIAVYKDKAYWVHNNIFYQSEITWEPDFTTAEPIDTMSLSNKELTDLLIILDELKEQEKG